MTADVEACDLHGKWVFLSASYPSPEPERDPAYWATADVRAISNAVVELTRAIFEVAGSLVFGGHPTISPLVLDIAESTALLPGENGAPRIRIYQSAVFSGLAPAESRRIGELDIGEEIETERVGDERPVFRNGVLVPESVAQSLALMRQLMIEDTEPVAAVFIGGMEGIEEEHRIVADLPDTRPYLVVRPGGAARVMADQGKPVAPHDVGGDLREGLRTSQLFPWLMRSLVEDIAAYVR